jgi:hypothetical protein
MSLRLHSCLLMTLSSLFAQAPQTPATPKAAAPVDLTGYWVSAVTEDWLYRMVTPAKGDYTSVPLNAEGRKLADAWDPTKDEAAGDKCKAYGAPFIMRIPGRVHITWQDDNTLKVEKDSGTQTRLFHFGGVIMSVIGGPGEGLGRQGASRASWDIEPGGRRVYSGAGLKVVTTQMKPGYLRKNGVPYSANTVLTEYYDRVNEPNGDSWLIVETIVEDPAYLTQPFITSTHFKKQADSTGWNPTPCAAR